MRNNHVMVKQKFIFIFSIIFLLALPIAFSNTYGACIYGNGLYGVGEDCGSGGGGSGGGGGGSGGSGGSGSSGGSTASTSEPSPTISSTATGTDTAAGTGAEQTASSTTGTAPGEAVGMSSRSKTLVYGSLIIIIILAISYILFKRKNKRNA